VDLVLKCVRSTSLDPVTHVLRHDSYNSDIRPYGSSLLHGESHTCCPTVKIL
jgi:hypothetical protein